GRTDAARAIAAPLLRAVRAAVAAAERDGAPASTPASPLEVIPVPSPAASLRRRGYAPVEVLLARAGIRPMRAPGVPGLRGHPLRFTRRPADQ
ncbi:ComF family protein, partial [Clavibacter lycopersici]